MESISTVYPTNIYNRSYFILAQKKENPKDPLKNIVGDLEKIAEDKDLSHGEKKTQITDYMRNLVKANKEKQ